MVDNVFRLMSAVEAEEELGVKYFYRQRTYRMQKAGKLRAFDFRGQQCFLPHKLIGAYIDELRAKVRAKAPELKDANIFYDEPTRRMVVDGIYGRYVAAQTDKENEENLMSRLLVIREWVMTEGMDEPGDVDDEIKGSNIQSIAAKNDLVANVDDRPSGSAFPSDIKFIQIQTNEVAGVALKSNTLMSLPSIARFIGVRPDHLTDWLQKTSFVNYVVSIHNTKLDKPDISGLFKKGFARASTPMLPLEFIPELLVAFRQSGRTPELPARAEQLYMIAKSTLEAVGLAISGNGDKAATELARVGASMGISTADQVIALFKRYESRPFQVKENFRFRGKVKNLGLDYRIVTGEITVGVTGRSAGAWKALGAARKLPSKDRTSAREVMRHIEPENSVGITFSESHFLKDHRDMGSVIQTGKQAKEFYTRLKEIGLLDD